MILIIGTGGLTKQFLPLINPILQKGEDVIFFDNTESASEKFFDCPVIGTFEELGVG